MKRCGGCGGRENRGRFGKHLLHTMIHKDQDVPYPPIGGFDPFLSWKASTQGCKRFNLQESVMMM